LCARSSKEQQNQSSLVDDASAWRAAAVTYAVPAALPRPLTTSIFCRTSAAADIQRPFRERTKVAIGLRQCQHRPHHLAQTKPLE
jgi:hypothetical protein